MLSRKELYENLNSLRYGDRITITRDLSLGKMEEDMIQTLSVQVYKGNIRDMRDLFFAYPVLELEINQSQRFRYN